MYKQIYYTLLFIYLCLPTGIYGQKTNYQLFENISLGAEASVICCFMQDSQGLIWIGSDKGLFSYDGYSAKAHFTFGRPNNTRINCGVIADSTYLYLGADNGIHLYNYRIDRYEKSPVTFPTDVRTLALQDETLWIGTLNGLYTYQLKTKELKHFDQKQYNTLPHSTVYSIIRSHNNRIYIGTYNGFCSYSPKEDTFKPIHLPTNVQKSNQFINSLLEDTTRQCIWIGTEGSLFKYSPQNGTTEKIEMFRNNSIKSLALDGYQRLLIGTDNGLYVYTESKAALHRLHDSRNQQSLSSNIIWDLFTDSEANVWLGTDNGISLSHQNSAFQYIPIAQITGTGEGNRFYSLFKDSKNSYWFGGTNGLIRFSTPLATEHHYRWYKMGDKYSPLPHSRIRHIYEDREQELWIATDGSINRFDYTRNEFVRYNIVDSTRTYNANWAYHLFEDGQKRLWIATCLGGIFIVDKQKLMQSTTKNYVAEYNITTRNGLSGMFISQIIPDHEGNVWVLLYNNGINKIDTRTRKVTPIEIGELTGEKNPNYLLCDHEGIIWAGFRGGVIRITPKDNRQQIIRFDTFSSNEVLSMMDVEAHIWVSTTDGCWIIDKKTGNIRRLNLSEKRFTGMFFDSIERQVYLGEVDGFAVTSPEILTASTSNRPILITALYINNLLLDNQADSIRYTHHLELNHNQNNFSIEISDLPYSLEEKNQFVYQLEGIDRDWNLLKPNSNRISYNNLNYGNYRLVINKLDDNGRPTGNRKTLTLRIHPPWYYSFWAKMIYALLFISLVVWGINFFRVKSRLKRERMEKEKILEQSRQKMDFFTNLSHELKTPLSLIISPISKLLPEVKNPQERKQLEGVQNNAMKLNSLIHQALDFSRMDSNSNALLILSHTELVGLVRNLFVAYEEAEQEKNVTFRFETNREKIYLDADVIKWGSILNNLLSNAIKYTPREGSITLSINYNDVAGELSVSVADTGTGIAPQDIPYIFQRFFQSPRTTGKKEGTGIGLYLVKTYTELHGGVISVTSEEHVGTTVTLTLPLPNDIEQPSTHALLRNENEEEIESAISTKLSIAPVVKKLPVPKPIEATSYDEKFLISVTGLIEDHVSDSELNVNALCELAGVNNKQIYRKLKLLTGMTPVEYIKSIRMKKAAMLLQQQKFSIAEVMYMVGFSNHSYFSKCFQAEFGKTPRQFMEEAHQ